MISGAQSNLNSLIFQDCLRACQEQIESLLETSLRQAQQQQHPVSIESKNIGEGQDLSATPTDVRDINIWVLPVMLLYDEGEAGWTNEVNGHFDKYKNTHGFVLHDVVRVLERSQVTGLNSVSDQLIWSPIWTVSGARMRCWLDTIMSRTLNTLRLEFSQYWRNGWKSNVR